MQPPFGNERGRGEACRKNAGVAPPAQEVAEVRSQLVWFRARAPRPVVPVRASVPMPRPEAAAAVARRVGRSPLVHKAPRVLERAARHYVKERAEAEV